MIGLRVGMSDLGVFKSSEFNLNPRVLGENMAGFAGHSGPVLIGYKWDFDKSCSLKESIEAFKKECGLEQPDNSIDKTLKERGERYGAFSSHAALSQAFKDVARTGDSYELLSASQLEALEMIFHKIARILNGDPDYADSWHDLAGYASLVEKELSE
jgi:hypothetical protein